MKRDGSRNEYFRQRIPKDVLSLVRGKTINFPLGEKTVSKVISASAKEIKLSLQTNDPSEIKSRNAVLAAHLETYWKALREGPRTLNHKEVIALAGEFYHDLIDRFEEDPGKSQDWQLVLERSTNLMNVDAEKFSQSERDAYQQCVERLFGAPVDELLARRSLIVDKESRVKLRTEVIKAASENAAKLKKFAEGDYSEDNHGKRFPKWDDAKSKKPKKSKPALDMMDLVDKWWKESERAGLSYSTYDGYKRTFENFCDFLKHQDATLVTPEDVVAYKDFRLERVNERTKQQVNPKTVRDQDLAGLKSIFNWALNNRLMKFNPAVGVTVKVGKPKKVRPKYFTETECKTILNHSKNYKATGLEKQQFSDAKRWVPWICAYTGARIGEILQLRKQDLKQEEGYWTYRITPEAGQVKTGEYRVVPIHEHLIEMGLLDFVEKADTDYLFILASNNKEAQKQVRTRRTKMSEFIREVFTDRNIQPNHGWRHTFKTKAREIDNVKEKVLDDITGHASRTEGDRYGESTIKAKALVMDKYPRYIL